MAVAQKSLSGKTRSLRTNNSHREAQGSHEGYASTAINLKGAKMTDPTKHRKEIRKMLEVEYTPAEMSEMGLELARKTAELRTKEDNKKSVTSQLKSEIDNLTAGTNDLSNKINTGSEYRNVKCELEYDYEKGTKRIIRLDTAVVVYEGPIPDEERQIEMTPVSADATKAAADYLDGVIDENTQPEGQSPEGRPSDSDEPQTEETEGQEPPPSPLIAQGSMK